MHLSIKNRIVEVKLLCPGSVKEMEKYESGEKNPDLERREVSSKQVMFSMKLIFHFYLSILLSLLSSCLY